MPSWLLFVLLTLASYRLWRLIGRDDITEFIRRPMPEKMRQGVECAYCLGSWIATIGVYLFHRYVQELGPHWLLWAVAVAGGVAFTAGFAEKVDS